MLQQSPPATPSSSLITSGVLPFHPLLRDGVCLPACSVPHQCFFATVGYVLADVAADSLIVERSRFEPFNITGHMQVWGGGGRLGLRQAAGGQRVRQ